MKTAGRCGGERNSAWLRLALFALGSTACQGPAKPQAFSYPEQALPLVLLADSNAREYGRRFALPRAGWLRVQCAGEVMPNGPLATRDLDHVTLYFDLGNQKRKSFGDGDDYQYDITRLPAKLIMRPVAQAGRLRYAFAEGAGGGTPVRYEVRVPWDALKYRPGIGQTFGFDCAATDDDTHQKDRVLCWHAADDEGFLNTALYGNLVLQGRPARTSADVVGCPYAAAAPVLDGRVDSLWRRLPSHPLASRAYGAWVAPANFAARFRTCWTRQGIFFLFEVQDDVAVFDGNAGTLRDYGWLEDAAGSTVWQLSSTARPNGGATKNRAVDTVIFLPPGRYLARYATDESHSPEGWDAPPPTNRFYGIAISLVAGPKKKAERGRYPSQLRN